jgi:hypothetical protein
MIFITKDEYLLQLINQSYEKSCRSYFTFVGAKKTINFILLASVEMILLLYQEQLPSSFVPLLNLKGRID